MRLFIAIELPEEIKRGMAAIQEQLRKSGADAGWTRLEGIHLTLKFLGEVAEAKVPEIKVAMTEAVQGAAGFRLEVAGAGAFPNNKNPRVLWLGVRGDTERLALLQSSVEGAMVKAGFDPEDRAFSPHLTLARIKYLRPRFSWPQAIETIKDAELGGMDVTAVSLMKSELKPSGAVYTEMGRVELS
jgi:RNA 2',3'-cyclic 3'-phosphodiesterase